MVALNGQELAGWTFDYNNVLAWADQAGSYSAWLQALVLPGGPVFVGKVTTGDAYEGAAPGFIGFEIFVVRRVYQGVVSFSCRRSPPGTRTRVRRR